MTITQWSYYHFTICSAFRVAEEERKRDTEQEEKLSSRVRVQKLPI
jgi:hypothetical protein